MQCQQYRIGPMKAEIEEEIEKLDASLHTFAQMRNTEAVNRLAMLSLMIGAGAVVTGFFGMNFGRWFSRLFFEPDPPFLFAHYAAVMTVALLAFGALAFGIYVVFANWSDYKEILMPRPPDLRALPPAPRKKPK
jgi:Mg2+ and Co2+ transporter CorA